VKVPRVLRQTPHTCGLGSSGSPKGQRSGGTCQWHDPPESEAEDFQPVKQVWKRWLKQLPAVVWSLRTSRSRATGFTPFFMVYWSEAVLPTDLEYGSPRVQAYDEDSCKTFQEDTLDQLDEARDVALLHSAKYQQALRRYQARRVRGRAFQISDLVLRLRQSNKGRHKFTPPLGRTLRHRRSPPTRHLQARQ